LSSLPGISSAEVKPMNPICLVLFAGLAFLVWKAFFKKGD
jgi:hypothetical protein